MATGIMSNNGGRVSIKGVSHPSSDATTIMRLARYIAGRSVWGNRSSPIRKAWGGRIVEPSTRMHR